jgi:hypothetical protein
MSLLANSVGTHPILVSPPARVYLVNYLKVLVLEEVEAEQKAGEKVDRQNREYYDQSEGS